MADDGRAVARRLDPGCGPEEPGQYGRRAGDAVLTDNWHTREVYEHVRNNFEGHTFVMRTLEAWGAMIENDQRAYYTAGGRVWVLDLLPSEGKKQRLPGAGARKG